jgi:RNA polymerase sigma-70 factor (ECF subfamily)
MLPRARRGAGVEEIEALYRSAYPRFLRVAAAITGSESAGSDAVQDAFVSALRRRGSFRRDGSLESWVWTIVVNAARVSLRKRPAGEAFLGEPRGDASPEADPSGQVRAAVAALPERQRLILFLRYYADLDYRTIADAVGVAPGTVGATLNAAHEALRGLLEEVTT